MTKFQLLSDLHLEFHPNFQTEILPQLKTDADCLILAGDICEARNFERFDWFFQWCSQNYKQVYYCYGNHEWYSSPTPVAFFCKLQINHKIENFLLLRNNYAWETDNFVIIGDTTWTNYNNGDPLLMIDSDRMVNDKRQTGLTAQDCYDLHCEAIKRLKVGVKEYKDKNIIIITHHPITIDYLENSRFKGDKLNGAFCSDYNSWIKENPQIKHICSGHTHENWSGKIGETQYHINPLGYPGEAKNKEYKPYTFTI